MKIVQHGKFLILAAIGGVAMIGLISFVGQSLNQGMENIGTQDVVMPMLMGGFGGLIIAYLVLRNRQVLTGQLVVERTQYQELSNTVDLRTQALKAEIEKRKKIESALRESEALLSHHIHSTPLAAVVWDLNFRVLKWNTAAESIFGYSHDEAIGKHAADLIIPPDITKDIVEGVFQALLKAQGGERSTNDNVTASGQIITCEWYNTPLRNPAGEVVGVASLAQDITVQKAFAASIVDSDERFRKAFQLSPDAFAVNRVSDGLYVDINDSFTAIAGYSREEIVGKLSSDIGIWADLNERKHIVELLLSQNGVSNMEASFRHRDGHIFVGLISASKIVINEVPHMLSITKDVSEIKAVETSLRESEERFREFAAAASDWLWETDADHRFTWISDESVRKTWQGPGKARWEMSDTSRHSEIWTEHKASLDAHRSFTGFEYEIRNDKGATDWVKISGKPNYDVDGNFTGYRGVGRYVTDRKVAELKLLENEARFRDFTETASDWVWEQDRDFRFTHVSDRYFEITNFAKEIIIGKTRWEIVADNVFAEYPEKWQEHRKCLDAHLPFRDFSYNIVTPEGERRHLNLNGNPVFDPEGTFIGYRGTGSDITGLYEAQEKQKRAREEAETANRAKSEFLSSMSHELRTPMNAIMGFAQMLEFNPKEPLTKTQKSSVDLILKGSHHLLELIEQVLELSKIEAGHLSLSIDHTSVRDVIDNCLYLIRPRADSNGIRLVDQIDGDDLPLLWTDSTRLTQVLLNLLSNAVKYNCENGKVTITCQQIPDQKLRISVADSGPGIPVKHHDNLFKPFERLGRESGSIEGTGIGLTITKQIIEVLGGQVGFDSTEGRGSTFWVDVPMSEKRNIDAARVKKERSTDKTINILDEEGSQYSVLYVEDNPANMQLMEMMIGRIANTKLLTAYNAELGLDLAKVKKPDLILMDINLPGMDGIKALKLIRETKETKDTPVIAISAAAMPAEVEAGMKAGFKNYITKPINVTQCIRTIEGALDSVKEPV